MKNYESNIGSKNLSPNPKHNQFSPDNNSMNNYISNDVING